MTKRDPIKHYIAGQPKAVREILERVRRAVLKAVPEAEESISYDMPAYRLHGARLLQFACWKNHFSLYLASDRVVAAFRGELAACRIQKGTISFPLAEPVPEKLIEEIAKFRAREIVARRN